MQEWSEAVWVAISLIVTTVVIFFSTVLNGESRNLRNVVNEQHIAAERMQEIRTYLPYDNKEIYCQDVVSFILETRGDPYTIVQVSPSVSYTWNSKTKASNYSATDIMPLLNVNKTYQATLQYTPGDEGGTVVGVKFTQK